MDNNNIFVSAVTEIELLGWHKISAGEKEIIKDLLADCTIIELTNAIKEISISLKQKYRIKVPDAIVAATSIFLDFPLVTFDKKLMEIKELNSVLL